MQVELAEVEARVAGSRDAEDAVRVRLVVVADAAGRVHELDHAIDLRVEDARVLGVRDHQAGGALGERSLERLDRRQAVRARVERDEPVARGRRPGAVAGVGEDRRDDLVSLALPARGLAGGDHARVRVDRL